MMGQARELRRLAAMGGVQQQWGAKRMLAGPKGGRMEVSGRRCGSDAGRAAAAVLRLSGVASESALEAGGSDAGRATAAAPRYIVSVWN